MWASGYDWKNDLAKIVAQIGSVLGFDKVWSIHLNDSKTALASKKDRHENLGDGLIGRQALMEVINHPNLSSIPVILETPDLESIDGAKREIGKLREMVKE
jgi:deoxyribonuclease-4